jgi:hypothetical protein
MPSASSGSGAPVLQAGKERARDTEHCATVAESQLEHKAAEEKKTKMLFLNLQNTCRKPRAVRIHAKKLVSGKARMPQVQPNPILPSGVE